MKLSIITINYNNVNGLIKTVQSVINQNAIDFEYIIVDGNSTDGSREFIEQNKNKFNYWVSEPDRGIYHAMNKGIEVATGEYCLFLNSGDYLVNNNVIRSVINSFESNKVLYFGKLKLADQLDTIVNPPEELYASYFLYNSLPHPATFFRRKNILSGYNEKFKIAGDFDLIMKLLFNEQVSYEKIDISIAYFDLSGISSKNSMLNIHDFERNQILNNYIPKIYFKDIYRVIECENKFNNKRIKYLNSIEKSFFLRITITPILLIFSMFSNFFNVK